MGQWDPSNRGHLRNLICIECCEWSNIIPETWEYIIYVRWVFWVFYYIPRTILVLSSLDYLKSKLQFNSCLPIQQCYWSLLLYVFSNQMICSRIGVKKFRRSFGEFVLEVFLRNSREWFVWQFLDNCLKILLRMIFKNLLGFFCFCLQRLLLS